MNLDDFIITCFCLIDEMVPMILKDQRLRARGPEPKLSDSEVITMEVVGSYLSLSQDKELFRYFQRHYTHFFPALKGLHRSTFVRQSANLWAIKERLWCWLRDEMISYDGCMSIVDSVPVPICRFARAPWCIRFRCQASYGKDHADRQTFYGFRLHAQLSWPGLLTRLFLAPANRTEKSRPSCWRAPQALCWVIATLGCLICKRFCEPRALFCKHPFAKRIPRKRRPTKVLSWDGFAISSTPSLVN